MGRCCSLQPPLACVFRAARGTLARQVPLHPVRLQGVTSGGGRTKTSPSRLQSCLLSRASGRAHRHHRGGALPFPTPQAATAWGGREEGAAPRGRPRGARRNSASSVPDCSASALCDAVLISVRNELLITSIAGEYSGQRLP